MAQDFKNYLPTPIQLFTFRELFSQFLFTIFYQGKNLERMALLGELVALFHSIIKILLRSKLGMLRMVKQCRWCEAQHRCLESRRCGFDIRSGRSTVVQYRSNTASIGICRKGPGMRTPRAWVAPVVLSFPSSLLNWGSSRLCSLSSHVNEGRKWTSFWVDDKRRCDVTEVSWESLIPNKIVHVGWGL